MKIMHKDLKHRIIKIKVDRKEDSWYLSDILEPEDKISGMTERKIKLGGSEEKSKISKRILFLKILVEKIDYDSDSLRISGPIIEAPDDIPKGDYHTFSIEDGTIITIEKQRLSNYFWNKVDEATKEETRSILIVAFDREEAIFAKLKSNGYETLLDLKGDVSKKDYEEKKGNFYAEIIKQMKDYDAKYSFTNIVAASPAFWKDYLIKELKDDPIKKKIILATCSNIDDATINEILKRPELKTVLENDTAAKESSIIEELLGNISKDNAAYGFADVQKKLDSGNISVLLISENLIKKLKSEKTFQHLDGLMNYAEKINAQMRIISSEDAMRKLDGLSGIACLLRWKENY